MGIATASLKAEVGEEIVTECKITYKLMGGV